jgi:hypothetical protein
VGLESHAVPVRHDEHDVHVDEFVDIYLVLDVVVDLYECLHVLVDEHEHLDEQHEHLHLDVAGDDLVDE